MTNVSIDHVAKAYGRKAVLHDINIEVPEGEFVSLLGPSGCGKTTTLNIVAGFVAADKGRVILGGKDITTAPPYARDAAIVFQNYALFPHMRVEDNVAYGLRAHKVPKAEMAPRVAEILRVMGIEDLARFYPGQLSGGQQQRVAVARSVVLRPGVLLMDEPLSNLDAKLRGDIRIELRSLQQRLNQTVLFVTHDQEEALSMSDRIVVMNNGRVEQLGTPEDVFKRPRTVFVADFMGVENVFAGTGSARGWESETGLAFPSPGADRPFLRVRPSDNELVAPESVRASDSTAVLPVSVTGRTYLGNSMRYQLEHGPQRLVALVPQGRAPFEPGDKADAVISAQSLLPLEESAGGSSGAGPGVTDGAADGADDQCPTEPLDRSK
jgi:ABC-type Fe3+/spermidine/putrescine transport system ATPase subunit